MAAGDVVSGSLTANGTGATAYHPLPRKPFNIWLTGTFSATVTIVRSIDGGTTWVPVAKPDLSGAAAFTAPITFAAFEPNVAALWNVQVSSYVSGTVSYRFDE